MKTKLSPCVSCAWIKVETSYIIAERDRLKAVNAELLEACKFIANTDQPGIDSDERYERIVMAQQAAQAAIAKATS